MGREALSAGDGERKAGQKQEELDELLGKNKLF